MSPEPTTIELAADETIDRLTSDWRIVQLRRGHRFNTDDLLTSWAAVAAAPGARRLLDLGAGVGSIGLLTLRRLSAEAKLVAIEVQAISASLMRKTVALNQLDRRVEVRCADLRAPEAFADGERFELITANPPYLPEGKASASPNPQRAAARLELHGDVFDYCRVAAARLAPAGRFCLCHAAADPRPEQAIAEAGLALLGRRDVVFRHGQPPMIALFACALAGGDPPARQDPPSLAVRGADGAWTERFRAIRLEVGIDD